jgi:hypothetical protein
LNGFQGNPSGNRYDVSPDAPAGGYGCGFGEENVKFFALSGFKGENIVTRRQGDAGDTADSGPSLIETIDEFRGMNPVGGDNDIDEIQAGLSPEKVKISMAKSGDEGGESSSKEASKEASKEPPKESSKETSVQASSRASTRFAVTESFGSGGNTTVVGKVVSGVMRTGQQVVVLPSRQKTTVKSMVVRGQMGAQVVESGQFVDQLV